MATVIHTTPASATNILLHGKLNADKEKVALPYTTYQNVMNAPKVLSDVGENIGAPFHLLATDTVKCTDDYIIDLCGHIL